MTQLPCHPKTFRVSGQASIKPAELPVLGLSDLATPSGPPSDLLTQCQALDRQRSATREGSIAAAAARADRLSRHLRQDLAREQLQGGNVFLVQHLEEIGRAHV